MIPDRPTTPTPEIVEEMLLRIREGQSLVGICKDEAMPSVRVAHRWIEADEDLQHKYARAREDQAERNAEQIVALADEVNRPGVTMEEIQVAKLRIDARKWIASKLLAKKYGDRGTEVNVNSTVNNNFVLSEQIRQRIVARREELLNQRLLISALQRNGPHV